MTALSIRPNHRLARGFTLIELMITVAIVAILASIALPAFRDSILKGKRAQARTALLELAQAQERYFTANNCYLPNATPGTPDAVGATAACPNAGAFKLYSGDNPATPAYKLYATASCAGSASGDVRQCIVMTAVPQFNDLDGGNISLWSTGFKTCSGNKPSVCWP